LHGFRARDNPVLYHPPQEQGIDAWQGLEVYVFFAFHLEASQCGLFWLFGGK
jgi:hypothetical protein